VCEESYASHVVVLHGDLWSRCVTAKFPCTDEEDLNVSGCSGRGRKRRRVIESSSGLPSVLVT
jgi:hypothetical protein